CHADSDPEYGPAATRGECTGSDERRQGEHTRPIRPTYDAAALLDSQLIAEDRLLFRLAGSDLDQWRRLSPQPPSRAPSKKPGPSIVHLILDGIRKNKARAQTHLY